MKRKAERNSVKRRSGDSSARWHQHARGADNIISRVAIEHGSVAYLDRRKMM